jgi:hypothetical protein
MERRHRVELSLAEQADAAAEWRVALIVLAVLFAADLVVRALWHRYREGEPPLDRYIHSYCMYTKPFAVLYTVVKFLSCAA